MSYKILVLVLFSSLAIAQDEAPANIPADIPADAPAETPVDPPSETQPIAPVTSFAEFRYLGPLKTTEDNLDAARAELLFGGGSDLHWLWALGLERLHNPFVRPKVVGRPQAIQMAGKITKRIQVSEDGKSVDLILGFPQDRDPLMRLEVQSLEVMSGKKPLGRFTSKDFILPKPPLPAELVVPIPGVSESINAKTIQIKLVGTLKIPTQVEEVTQESGTFKTTALHPRVHKIEQIGDDHLVVVKGGGARELSFAQVPLTTDKVKLFMPWSELSTEATAHVEDPSARDEMMSVIIADGVIESVSALRMAKSYDHPIVLLARASGANPAKAKESARSGAVPFGPCRDIPASVEQLTAKAGRRPGLLGDATPGLWIQIPQCFNFQFARVDTENLKIQSEAQEDLTARFSKAVEYRQTPAPFLLLRFSDTTAELPFDGALQLSGSVVLKVPEVETIVLKPGKQRLVKLKGYTLQGVGMKWILTAPKGVEALTMVSGGADSIRQVAAFDRLGQHVAEKSFAQELVNDQTRWVLEFSRAPVEFRVLHQKRVVDLPVPTSFLIGSNIEAPPPPAVEPSAADSAPSTDSEESLAGGEETEGTEAPSSSLIDIIINFILSLWQKILSLF